MKTCLRLICYFLTLWPLAGEANWEVRHSFLNQPYLPDITFNAVWGTGENDIFVAGTGGTLLHFDGNSWRKMESGTENTLYAVSGTSRTDIFAVGEKGTLLHYDGGQWRRMLSGTEQNLSCIRAFSEKDVFAAGNNGKILHFDGNNWIETPSGTPADVKGFWGNSASHLFAVGSLTHPAAYGGYQTGVILHFDGNRWETMPVPESIPGLTGIWGPDENNLYAFTLEGAILHYDGQLWRKAQPHLTGENPWASDTGQLFTIESNGYYVCRFDGTERMTYFHGAVSLKNLWGTSDHHVLVVGSAGSVYRFDGQTWTQVLGGPEQERRDRKQIWAFSTTDVYAIHEDNTIRHFDGRNWSIVYAQDGYYAFNYMWGSSQNDIYVVGQEGLLLHFNGSQWAKMESGTNSNLIKIWGFSGTDVFAANDEGSVFHYEGLKWKAVAAGAKIADGLTAPPRSVREVWGTSPTNLFTAYIKTVAPGETACDAILHFDGHKWSEMTLPQKIFAYNSDPSFLLFGQLQFSGSAGNDVHLLEYIQNDSVGSPFIARILHFDGVSWTEIWAPETGRLTGQLNALWGDSAKGLFCVGENVILHFDGVQWDRVSLDKDLYHINGTSPSNIFAGEYNGAVVHFDGERWTTIAGNPNRNAFNGIWGSTPQDVFAVGGEGIIFHYDGTSWLEMNSAADANLHDVWGRSGTDVFAVGEWGTILHFDGTAWHEMESGTRDLLTGIWGDTDQNVYVTGYNGLILHYDGSTWSKMESGSTKNFLSIWGISANDVHVASNDSLHHFDGTAWNDVTDIVETKPCSLKKFRVFGSSGAVYFINSGCDYNDSGFYRYDGKAWEFIPMGNMNISNDDITGPLWGGSKTDIFALSTWKKNIISHYDGAGWTQVTQNGFLNDLWGAACSDVFAAGENGTLLRLARPDTTTPEVTQTDPANGEPLVDPNLTRILIDFSKTIDIRSVDETGFIVRGPSGIVPGEITLGNAPDQLLFTPSESLQPGASYSVTLSGDAIRDTDGNSMVAAVSWTFTTQTGVFITPDLWISAKINTVDSGLIEAVWKKCGEDSTARGDTVVWGYFYADPADVDWGDPMNPDLFVKIWFDVDRHVYISYLHVSVPEISAYSRLTPHSSWQPPLHLRETTRLGNRYAGHYYFYQDRLNGDQGGYNYGSESQFENGISPLDPVISMPPPGVDLMNQLRIGAVINTADKGDLAATWKMGGQGLTARGDTVLWGYFYADPAVVSWGSPENPDLFVKIWFDVTGPVYVDFFHASVPDICVYSDLPAEGNFSSSGITLLKNRLVEHRYNAPD